MKYEYDFDLMAHSARRRWDDPDARFYLYCYALDENGKRLLPPAEAKLDLTRGELEALVGGFKDREKESNS